AVLEALGAQHVGGAAVKWAGVFRGDERKVSLPLYPWQRERYWLEAVPKALAGEETGHPLLGTRIDLAEDGAIFESLITRTTHGWLYDHIIGELAVVPGAGIGELIRAAGAAYFNSADVSVSTLILQSPLILGEDGQHIQVTINDNEGIHEVIVWSRETQEKIWKLHATAEVEGGSGTCPTPLDLAAIKARCERQSDTDEVYQRFADLGLPYGPAFRGMQAIHTNENEVLASLKVLDEIRDVPRFGIHPVLLDSAFQAYLSVNRSDVLQLPFSIDSFVTYRNAPREVYAWVKGKKTGNNITTDVVVCDHDGNILTEVKGLHGRPTYPLTFLSGHSLASSIYKIRWDKTEENVPQINGSYLIIAHPGEVIAERVAVLLRDGGNACEVIDYTQLAMAPLVDNIVCCFGFSQGFAETNWGPLSHGLAVLRHLEQKNSGARLWWVTRGAIEFNGDIPCDIAQYGVWGAGRTLRHEYPHTHCTLIDIGQGGDATALAEAIIRDDAEREVVLTAKVRYVPRLVQATGIDNSPLLSLTGTVLISGGLGAIGLQIAHCLVKAGVPHLILTCRRGFETPGAVEAVLALEQRGAKVTVIAADIADPQEVGQLLGAVPHDLPLQGVVHAAGVLDDAILLDHDDERLAKIFSAKVQGAFNLDVQTRSLDLTFFVLFSSIAGTLGSAGQGGYAAANACLDAIASNRRKLGLAGQSLAWGLWTDDNSQALGVAAGLNDAQHARIEKNGLGVVKSSLGCRLFEAVAGSSESRLLLSPIDAERLRMNFKEEVPYLWKELLKTTGNSVVRASRSHHKVDLSSIAESARFNTIVEILRDEIMSVLSISETEVQVNRPLSELGLDSLMAVELRNALRKRTGKTLPATLAFDYPTISNMAVFIAEQFTGHDTELQPTRVEYANSGMPQSVLFSQLNYPERPKMRVFFFPYAGGSADSALRLVKYFPDDVEVHALNYPGRGNIDVDKLRRDIISAITQYADKPYIIVGHSMGAMFAHDAVKSLSENKVLPPILLVVSGFPQPTRYVKMKEKLEKGGASNFIYDISSTISEQNLPQDLIEEFARDMKLGFGLPIDTRVIDVPIIAMAGIRDPLVSKEELDEWRAITSSEFSCYQLPGGHHYWFEEKNSSEFINRIVSAVQYIGL
ncbi:SDR family NAD(P)-dependent oxidoreductase, partial [Salmonella enterica]|nr:SDR family NAD(P)-dependent oxidoreductase [Salmonella enterica]